jgi:hypothetical protein
VRHRHATLPQSGEGLGGGGRAAGQAHHAAVQTVDRPQSQARRVEMPSRRGRGGVLAPEQQLTPDGEDLRRRAERHDVEPGNTRPAPPPQLQLAQPQPARIGVPVQRRPERQLALDRAPVVGELPGCAAVGRRRSHVRCHRHASSRSQPAARWATPWPD